MRTFLISALFTIVVPSSAQTVVSVQDGIWNVPSTWDCGCVPDNTQNVVIMHSVEITTTLLIANPQVQVTTGGELIMSLPASISLSTAFINEGHVLLMGTVHNVLLFNNAGFAEFIGQFDNLGSILIDVGALLQVEGNFTNYELLQGDGAMCVADTTINGGTISGTLDFCDGTPTVFSPPFIDVNFGTVESGITFCQNGPCASGVQESFGSWMSLSPSIASDQVTLAGIPLGASVRLVDAVGRIGQNLRSTTTDRLELPLSALPNGAYNLLVQGAAGQRVLPFVIAR